MEWSKVTHHRDDVTLPESESKFFIFLKYISGKIFPNLSLHKIGPIPTSPP